MRADKTLMQDPFPPPPDGGVCSAQTNCVPSFMCTGSRGIEARWIEARGTEARGTEAMGD